jgi:excisionase family DNA binding protein
MEIEVKEASRRLGVNDSRVRQLLRAGSLRGRRVGNSWIVLADDVARLEKNRLRAGRPLAAPRAWAALDLLSTGRAPWLSDSARSQVRSHLARLDQPSPELWLSLLRSRSNVVRALAHPAALKRLASVDDARRAGPSEAVRRGFDLVVLGNGTQEFYVEASAWPQVALSLAIRESAEPNLIVRIPRDLWPFGDSEAVSDAALAADLLESAEPRAVTAGASRLNAMLAQWQRDRAERPQLGNVAEAARRADHRSADHRSDRKHQQ